MQLSLARWEDENGSSAGWWLIREIPGFYLNYVWKSWVVECFTPESLETPQAHQGQTPLQKQASAIWGENFTPQTELYKNLPPAINASPGFTRRAEALNALSAALNHNTPSSLSQALTTQ